jgi:polar amino acid transport system substrate-binding protein
MKNWLLRLPEIIFLAALTICLIPAWLTAQETDSKLPLIITGHPDRPFFAYKSGDRIIGLGPDLADIILSNLAIPHENRFSGPWNRVQELARNGKVDLIAGLYRTIERETFLAFSEPFFDDPTSVFVAKHGNVTISNQQDLVDWRGTTLFGDSFGNHLDHFIENELRMNRVYATEEMFSLLLSDKVDYLIFGYYSGRIVARRMGVEDQVRVAMKRLVVEKICLALSRQSPYIHLLPAINREIRRLRDEGRIDELVRKYMIRFHLAAD